MDKFVYNAFCDYFHAVGLLGYMKQKNVNSLLVLNFFYELMYHDYRGYIKQEDYHAIDKALNCLYGTNCLIPYPDYLKMGKLHLGDMTEVLSRTKALEEYDKELNQRILDNDVLIADNIRRLDEDGTRLDDHDSHLATHDGQIEDHERRLSSAEHTITDQGNTLVNHEGRISTIERTTNEQEGIISDHEGRITAIENTKVAKGKELINTIPDIVLPASL